MNAPTGHKKIVCRACGATVSQCRCMDRNKTVEYVERGSMCPKPAPPPPPKDTP